MCDVSHCYLDYLLKYWKWGKWYEWTKNEIGKSKKLIKETLKLGPEDEFYLFSSVKKNGKEELIDNIFGDLVEE